MDILCASDNPLHVDAVRSGLRPWSSFVLHPVETPDALLALLDSRTFDVLILEDPLAGVDGLQVLAAVRRGSDIPIVVLTPHDWVPADPRIRYLAHPLVLPDLVAALHDVRRGKVPGS